MSGPACASAAHGEAGGRGDARSGPARAGEPVPRAPASPAGVGSHRQAEAGDSGSAAGINVNVGELSYSGP
jgi:hypothetical protein